MSNIKEAEKDYIAGLKYKEIAEKYGVSLNTVKSWKTRYSWTKKVCTQKQKGVHTKRGAPKGSKNALGNRGGHAPPGNHNAVTHGLFAKIIPEDDMGLLTESGKLQGLEYELQVARYKVNRLIREQEQQQMRGTMASSDGPLSYSLKDDFYEQSIQRGLDLVRKIEAQLQKERIDKEKLEIEREKLSILQAKVKADNPLSGVSDTEIEVMLTDGKD